MKLIQRQHDGKTLLVIENPDGTVREVGLGKSDFILRKVLGMQV